MNDKPNYYAIIPAPVRYDKKLTCQAKLLYGEITALANKEGYCWANNIYFSKLYEVVPNTISRCVQELLRGRYIEIRMLKDNTRHIFIKELKQDDSEGGIIKNDETSQQLSVEGINKIVAHNNTINIFNNNNKDVDMLITFLRTQHRRYFGTDMLQGDVDNYVDNILEYGSEWVFDASQKSHKAGVRNWSYLESILKNRKKKKIAADKEIIFQESMEQTKIEFTEEDKKATADMLGDIARAISKNKRMSKGKKRSTHHTAQDSAAGDKKGKGVPKYATGSEAREEAEREFQKELEKGR